jgi:DNA polymerase III subunit alpha
MASKFIHLHTHSHYSLLNALPKIDELVEMAKKYEMPALALTDNGNLYGAIEFYKACKKENIKPIIGIDAYVAARTRHDMQAGVDNKRTRLVLLAKNNDGYKNLIKLVTASFLEGFYYKPRIDKEIIEKYAAGLLCILPSFSSDLTVALKTKDTERAKQTLEWYKAVYGRENVFIEITHHPELPGHSELMEELVALAKETQTPVVAAHDVYYIDKDDRQAREVLTQIQNNGDMSDRAESEVDFSFIGEKEAVKFFKKHPEAIENTMKIAEMCSLNLELGKWVFPDYKVESGLSYDDELKKLVFDGFKRRNLPMEGEVLARAEYELKVIKDKGYAPYFLVVSDLLRFAHENKILTTIRGSVAGSLVTYLAGITNVDPLEYKLPFERFLNPDRPSAPDIDMDYADNRRDEVIAYAKQKYGEDKVAQIGTFGTMAARGAVKDVARAMGYPYSVGDRISKMIPMGSQGFPMTIDRALADVADLKKMYKEEPDTKEIIDMAKKIEGCARHIGIHAAGVVISPTPLTDFVPLQLDPKGENKIITQFDMHSVEEAGLLKFDFLGIKNLSILADAVDRVKKIENIDVDIEHVPVDDKKTFEMLAKGETIGLFQLNGGGMTKALMELKPTSIHDINVMVALYRPGPMATIDEYIKRKHGKSKTTYYHPKMQSFLDRTYGLLVYQDDLLYTAIELAGYDWGTVDKFRKAVGKKIPEEMAKQHTIFVAGCVKHSNMTEKDAEKIWDLFEPFQGYGFNKAHAASYGRVAYQTAYMKANFPAIYMSAVLTADSGDVEKIGETITECKRMGIPVLAPSVNESYSQFTIIKGKPDAVDENERKDRIRFGLVTIKNFGQGASSAIIETRKKDGRFKSIEDFLDRVRDKNLNKKSLEALIKAGALDEFGERGIMLANLDHMLAYNKERIKSASSNQDSLFGMTGGNDLPPIGLTPAPPAPIAEKLIWEKELLGLYLSGHPLDKYRDILTARDVNIKRAKEEFKDGMTAVLAGIIEEAKNIVTKKGDNMMFLKITDFSGTMEAVVFPKVYAEFKALLEPEKCIALKGRISDRNGSISLIAEKVKGL